MIRKPESTKNSCTPIHPPFRYPKWRRRTRVTAIPRSPSSVRIGAWHHPARKAPAWRSRQAAGGTADRLLESPAEGGLGVVADVERHRRDLGRPVRQQARRHLHPPAREVLHRRLADEVREALGQRGPREPGLAGQRLHRPGPRRLLVEQPQRAADHRVAQAGEPARLPGAEAREMAPHDLDEEHLADPQEHAVAARLPVAPLGQREVEQRRQPVARGLAAGRARPADVEQARERGQDGIERRDVAAEEAADGVDALGARRRPR